MTTHPIENLSLRELIEINARLQRAIATAKERERDAVRQQINLVIDNSGFNLDEIADIMGFGGARRGDGKVAPKYRNPENRLETWTGRGRQPRWLSARLSKGAKLADFVI